MNEYIGGITLLLLSICLYAIYLKDKERFRIYKHVAVLDLILATISFIIYFLKH